MYKKIDKYLKKGTEEQQMYKCLLSVLICAILIYLLYTLGIYSTYQLKELTDLQTIFDFIIELCATLGFCLVILIGVMNILFFGIKIFNSEKVSIHMVMCHILNLSTTVIATFLLNLIKV